MSYTNGLDDPSAYFQTLLHAEDDTAFTFDGNSDLQPDMIWNKNRDESGYHHHIVDSVRGVSKLSRVSAAIAEFTSADSITAIGSDGFTTGADNNGYVSSGTDKQVSWCWKAGTSFTNDASSTGIGDIDSAGSVNTDAGFSVITATSDGAANKDIAHGLGAVPDVIISKNLERGYNWDCYFKTLGYNASLILNTTEAARTGAWGSNTFTTTTFETAEDYSSKNGEKYVYYCFAEKQGYSKFGSYTGNGDANGTFIYTGFKPAWFMLKQTNATDNWHIFDNKRDPFNMMEENLRADLANVEFDSGVDIDFVSNGVKLRNTDDNGNGSGDTYIFMAFAENPFVTSTGVPATAR